METLPISIVKSAGLSRSRFVELSAFYLLNAGILANDRAAAALEAKKTYGKLSGGMWKKIQSDAKKIIRQATEYGITLEKPYFIKDKIVYGFLSDGLAPLC